MLVSGGRQVDLVTWDAKLVMDVLVGEYLDTSLCRSDSTRDNMCNFNHLSASFHIPVKTSPPTGPHTEVETQSSVSTDHTD